MGGANSEVIERTKRIVFEAAYFKPASIRATSKKLGLEDRSVDRASSAAPISPRRRARWRGRCELLETDRRRHAPRRRSPTSTPRRISRRRCRLDRARIAGLLGMDVPDDAVERILTSLGFDVRQAAIAKARAADSGWDVIAAAMARRHASPGRSDRGGRAPLRLRASADDVPRRRAGAAAVGSAHRARSPRAHRAARHGLLRGDHVRVHRGGSGRAVPRWRARRWRSRTRCRRSSPSMRPSLLPGLVDARQPQSPPRAARRPPLRDRHALLAGGRNARRGFAWMGLGTRRSLERRAAAGGFLRHQGRRRTARGAGSVSRRRSRRSSARTSSPAAPRRSSIDGQVDRRPRPARRRRSPTRAICPPAEEVYVAEINLDAVTAAVADRNAHARRRCRGTRSSCATSRFSSTMPCLPKRFVAPFVRPRPTR